MPRFPLTGKSKRSLAAGWMWVKCGQSPLHESPGSSFGPAGDDWTRAKDQATPPGNLLCSLSVATCFPVFSSYNYKL